MVPCYAANMAPPFVRYWHGWNRPIDAIGLGNHKTIVGFALGIVAALVAAYAQSRIGHLCIDAGLWVRRVRRSDAFLFIRNSLLPNRFRSGIVSGVSTYSVVQICGATSLDARHANLHDRE